MDTNPGHQTFPNYIVFLEKIRFILPGPENAGAKFPILTKNRVDSPHDPLSNLPCWQSAENQNLSFPSNLSETHDFRAKLKYGTLLLLPKPNTGC